MVFAGGGGLLLLMQPDSNGIRLSETNRAFIPIPSRCDNRSVVSANRARHYCRPDTRVCVSAVLHVAPARRGIRTLVNRPASNSVLAATNDLRRAVCHTPSPSAHIAPFWRVVSNAPAFVNAP